MSEQSSFYLDPFSALLDAMIQAEGGPDAFVKAVQCSLPEVQHLEEAIARACKTVRNLAATCPANPLMMVPRVGSDPWTQEAMPRRLAVTDAFISSLAAKWAPIGAANDPHGLNRNWEANVLLTYHKLTR